MIEKITEIGSTAIGGGIGALAGSEKTGGSLVRTAATAAAGTVVGPSFAAMLGDMATDAVGALKEGETAAFDGISGTATTREVVDAMLHAEQTLKTAVALRDKVVQAYLEITKMQI